MRASVGAWRVGEWSARAWDRRSGTLALSIALTLSLILSGCRQKMYDQPKYKPLTASTFFDDGRASRPEVAGTVARGHLDDDALFYTGKDGNDPSPVLPFPVTRDVLLRGQERFDIFCSPCHDRVGTGDGMIVRRGYKRPPSFHIDRLRNAPVGYLFDVITHGSGAMPSYAAQIPPRDRWAILAYLRALQLSQQAQLADVPPAEQPRLEGHE